MPDRDVGRRVNTTRAPRHASLLLGILAQIEFHSNLPATISAVIFGNIQEIAKNALFINCLKCGCKGIIAHHDIQAQRVLSSSNVKAPALG